MIPILHREVYDLINDTINYNNGICRLTDAIECKTTEKLNGSYELSMSYPIGGTCWDEIIPGRIIIAQASEKDDDLTQPFTITKVTKRGGKLAVNAQHISYRLNGLLVTPPASGISTMNALRDYLNGNTARNPFTFYADSGTAVAEPIKFELPQDVYSLIYGGSNSVMKAFAGLVEMRFNRLNVGFMTARGEQRPFKIKYGVNLLSASEQLEPPDQVQFTWPYAKLQKNATEKDKIYIDLRTWDVSPIVDIEGDSYRRRQQAIDVSEIIGDNVYYDDIVQWSRGTAQFMFRQYAEKWCTKNQTPVRPSAITVSYIDLADTDDYSFLQKAKIGLGDIITVEYPMYGININQEVTTVVYNVLKDRNESVVVGTPNETVIEKIAAKLQERSQK